jgi:asparagine synthase (glutamine-hydrolysing)
MAWGVESRTPFLDYRLLEFTMGLPERYIYKRGTRKALLRDAMHNIIPDAIENRKDKMGFVTPEEVWLKGEGKEWFLSGVDHTIKLLPAFFNESKVRQFCSDMIDGKTPFDFTIWRILSLGKWYASMIYTSQGIN